MLLNQHISPKWELNAKGSHTIMTIRIVSWNIAQREDAWRALLDTDADIALLQEAPEPSADVANRIDVNPGPWCILQELEQVLGGLQSSNCRRKFTWNGLNRNQSKMRRMVIWLSVALEPFLQRLLNLKTQNHSLLPQGTLHGRPLMPQQKVAGYCRRFSSPLDFWSFNFYWAVGKTSCINSWWSQYSTWIRRDFILGRSL